MRAVTIMAALLVGMSAAARAQAPIGEISTSWRLIGPNDKVVVERYDDPRVENVSCYMSRAQAGGVSGWVGFAEDPSRFSIACRAVGPVTIPDRLPANEVVGFASASPFFKAFFITRMVDPVKQVLTYTVVSRGLINGSPFNSISAVPAGSRP